MNNSSLRNLAIIAHVDHGKTTLVDQILKQCGALDVRAPTVERVMDSNDLERERGITILAKNTAVTWRGVRINVVDTPGHADFGGEVERVLSMVDSVLLLVDAVEGPMPQTRFVTQKAFARGLKPIVVVNKIDRPGARIEEVINETFDLFDRLGASEEQLDFPVIYCSGLGGYAGLTPDVRSGDLAPLLDTILERVPPPDVQAEGPFQLQVSAIDYSTFVGAIGIGRIARGSITPNTKVTIIDRQGATREGRVLKIHTFLGLERRETEIARAGDIVAFTGIEAPRISDTLCDPACPEALPSLAVDEPTVVMTFEVNTSPFSGRSGKYVTSRHLRERLTRELIHNVALRVEDTEDPDRFRVHGRGELHLSILIENMRREGYEIAVSRPEVLEREIDGVRHEPWEQLAVDVEEQHQGALMEQLAQRGGRLEAMRPDGKGRVRLDYRIPSRGLIGFRNRFLSMTSGSGLMHHVFDGYAPALPAAIEARPSGAMVSTETGKVLAYALFNLQERGRLLVGPGDEVYEGMIVGLGSRGNDMIVNPLKAKKLTNIRAAGKDDNVLLTPALKLTLENALSIIEDDELVEITPDAIRLRKRLLKESDRKRSAKAV